MKEAFRARRQLVRLLLAEVKVGKKPENGRAAARLCAATILLPSALARLPDR